MESSRGIRKGLTTLSRLLDTSPLQKSQPRRLFLSHPALTGCLIAPIRESPFVPVKRENHKCPRISFFRADSTSRCSFLSCNQTSRKRRRSSLAERKLSPFCRIVSLIQAIVLSRTCFFNSHSQTMMTDQPLASSCRQTSSSRCLLRVIFAVQNSVLVLGVVAFLQSLWPCQKQPCTKITVWYLGRTISGVPGRRLSFMR